MQIHKIQDYKIHLTNRESPLSLIGNSTSLSKDSIDNQDSPCQRFDDSVKEIYNSIELYVDHYSDEDLINDSVLHTTQLIRDTKNKKEFNNYSNINTLKLILEFLLNFNFNSSLSRSSLEMVAYLSSTNLLEKTEILHQEQFFKYIIDSANFTRNPFSFIILSNFSLESEENAKKCFLYFPPQFFTTVFNDEDNYNNSDFLKQKDFFHLSILSLLTSYCSYNVDENAALQILSSIKGLIILNENHILLLDELFYALWKLRYSCQCCIEKANDINLLECFQNIQCELNSEIIVTIFQYYGDSLNQNIKIPELDIDKLINYASKNDKILSGGALWLIWTYIDSDQNDMMQKFYTTEFFDLIKSIINLNESLPNVKLSMLVLSVLIEKADSQLISRYITDEIINLIIDCDYIESDDQLIVFHIICALNRLLNYYCSIGNNDFLDFLRSKLKDSTICDLDKEQLQLLNENCSQIMKCIYE